MSEQYETRTVSFNISGEFLTNTAREWFFYEGKDYEKVMELLKDSMSGTDTPEATIRRYAEDILLGRAALKGNTADGSYHLETYEPDEQETLTGRMNIWEAFTMNIQERKRLQDELERMTQRYETAMEYVPQTMKREVRKDLGELTQDDRRDEMLDSYIKRMTDTAEHKTEDYGWLEPDGTFHEVSWGDHQDWAENYIRTKMSEEQWMEAEIIRKDAVISNICGYGDFLARKGWVLLHSPSQGIASPTRDPSRRYTKAQKEFLYDYFTERKCYREADEIWKEE